MEDIILRMIDGIETWEDVKELKTFKIGDTYFSFYGCIRVILDGNTRNEFISYCNKVNWSSVKIKQWVKVRIKRRFNGLGLF